MGQDTYTMLYPLLVSEHAGVLGGVPRSDAHARVSGVEGHVLCLRLGAQGSTSCAANPVLMPDSSGAIPTQGIK